MAPPRPVWDQLQAANYHALIVSDSGVYTPSGNKVGPTPNTVEELVGWVEGARTRLKPTMKVKKVDDTWRKGGTAPQIWLLGDVVERYGWTFNEEIGDDETEGEAKDRAKEELSTAIRDSLDPLLADAEWKLLGSPNFWVQLMHTPKGKQRPGAEAFRITLVLERYAWMPNKRDEGPAGILGEEDKTELPLVDTEDDTAAVVELGRRLAWSIELLGTLPGRTGSDTGAIMIDMINVEKKGAVVDQPGPMPAGIDTQRGTNPELEPDMNWVTSKITAHAVVGSVSGLDATRFVQIDQTASYLASAGIDLPFGDPEYIEGDQAVEHALSGKGESGNVPPGLYRVTLPPGNWLVAERGLPDTTMLPWPHPLMDPAGEEAVEAWITAPTLDLLRDPVSEGGAGLSLDDLNLTAAYKYPNHGPALRTWVARLRDARKYAIETDDAAMYGYIKTIYAAWIGRTKKPESWQYGSGKHHHQPVWRASIMAHARARGRRHAAKIAKAYGRWPIRAITDSWLYMSHEDEVLWANRWDNRLELPEKLYRSTQLGAFVIDKEIDLETIPSSKDDDPYFDMIMASWEAGPNSSKVIRGCLERILGEEEEGPEDSDAGQQETIDG